MPTTNDSNPECCYQQAAQVLSKTVLQIVVGPE